MDVDEAGPIHRLPVRHRESAGAAEELERGPPLPGVHRPGGDIGEDELLHHLPPFGRVIGAVVTVAVGHLGQTRLRGAPLGLERGDDSGPHLRDAEEAGTRAPIGLRWTTMATKRAGTSPCSARADR